jgi:hypothetical protein
VRHGRWNWMAVVGAAAGIATLAGAGAGAARAQAARGDDQAGRYASLLRGLSPAVVTVMVVTHVTMQMGGRSADHDSRFEVPGVVVDGSGLIMTSIVPFSPEHALKLVMGASRAEMPQIKTEPTEIKVLFEHDEESTAFLAATDSNLGLAFLQLDDPAAHRVKPVDFTHPAGGAIGDEVVAVSRLGKGFDSTPYFAVSRLSGEVAKPRKAWVLDGQGPAAGLPVFSLSGGVLGVLAMVDPGLAESHASPENLFERELQQLAGGASPLQQLLIPASFVAPVIEQAREQASRKAAERAAKQPPPAHPSR